MPIRRVFPVAVLVGIGLEIWKYVFLFAWPWLDRKFTNEYGPFSYSVSIVIFSLPTALLVLAGAEWSARTPKRQRRELHLTSIARRKKRCGVPFDFRHRSRLRPLRPHISEPEHRAVGRR